jgi:hypothetical protein
LGSRRKIVMLALIERKPFYSAAGAIGSDDRTIVVYCNIIVGDDVH